MTKLVLFDFNGVLANTEELGYETLSTMLATRNIHYEREDYVEMLSGITYEEFCTNLRENHPELDDGFFASFMVATKKNEDEHMRAIDGVKELLQKLKDHNIPFAVCSNSGAENLLYKLKKIGLFDDFSPHIYSRHHVENPKPAPDIYELAARDRGIAPKDCMVVEDSVTGVTAGSAARMSVVGFVGEAHREDHEAEYLTAAGAQMIALNHDQTWDHIANFCGLSPILSIPVDHDTPVQM